MSIVLAWRSRERDESAPVPERVVERLQTLFSPLFDVAPPARRLEAGAAHIALLELPLEGWKLPRFERDPGRPARWALAIDFPVDVAALPRAANAEPGDGPLLNAAQALDADPLGTLDRLAPPFSLAWGSADGASLSIQTDALGMAQLFEFETSRLWAVTNKPMALRALGVELEPVAEEWALWAALDWFPLDSSGFRGLRHVAPGTRIVSRAGGIERTRHDALRGWVTPPPLPRVEALELAHAALRRQLASCAPYWERPDVSLTGGWDSRAVVAVMRAVGRALGLPIELTVRGVEGRPDVVLARELARRAGLPLRVRSASGLPAADNEALDRSLSLALLWQSGQSAPHRAATFLASGSSLRARRPSVTGQHGELGRRLRAIFADGELDPGEAALWSPAELERKAIDSVSSCVPSALRPELREATRERLLELFAAADRYSLEGRARLDFFTLHELTRRKGGALHSWQTRLLVAPFLAPDLIRALFSVPGGLDEGELHRHVISRDAPDWEDVPFTEELLRAQLSPAHPQSAAEESAAPWAQPAGRENYDRQLYWSTLGSRSLERALSAGGFWERLFDADRVRAEWPTAAPQVALLHRLDALLAGGAACATGSA